MRREPCTTCLWRRGTKLVDIPDGDRGCDVDMQRLLELRASCHNELGGKVFACHRLDRTEVCAGWIASGEAGGSVALRLAFACGLVEHPEVFEGIDPATVYQSWDEMIAGHDAEG